MRLTNAPQLNRPPQDDKQEGTVRPSHWRPDIEGLRAVAVGAVIAAHIGFFYSEGGFIGVDVFFVISGFLITSLLLREIDRTGRVSLAGFYARRAVRLLPAAVLVLLATLAAAWIWLPRTRMGDLAADAASAALNVVNIRLAMTGTDYLNADAEPSPLQHFWSLAVEEQYYLAWPLLLLAIALVAKRIWGGQFARRGHFHRRRLTAIAVVLVSIFAVSFALSVLLSAPDPIWSYFGIHTRAWELAAGALVAVAAARLRRVPRWAAAIASWTGLGLIVASVFVLEERTVFPGYAAALPVAGTVLVIAAGCAPDRFGATLLLRQAPFQYIGKISYGLYLWHWPLVMIGPSILGLEEPRLRDYLLLMAAAFVLAVASFHLVENPIRTRKPLVQVPSRALAMGGALLTTALTVSLVLVMAPMPTTAEEAAEITGNDNTVWELLDESSDVDTVPANLTPALDEAFDDQPSLYDDGCVLERDVTEVDEDACWYGDPQGEKTLVLMGDSHAAQWFPALNQLAEASGWKLVAMTKANCSLPDVEELDWKLERRYTECEDWKENAFDVLDDLKPDAVVASAYDHKEVMADDPEQAWEDGWVTSIERLEEVADQVYYMADTTDLIDDVPDCLAQNPEDASVCVGDMEKAIVLPHDQRQSLMDAVADAGAHVVDPIPWLCDIEQGTCPVVVGNILVYRDSNHLSARFVAELAPQIAVAIPLEAQAAADE